jgi:YceI-like domain
MISNIKGHFTKFEGQIVMPEDPLKSDVTATIDMTSIDTANATRDKHLRSPTSSTWTGTPRCAIAPPASGLAARSDGSLPSLIASQIRTRQRLLFPIASGPPPPARRCPASLPVPSRPARRFTRSR